MEYHVRFWGSAEPHIADERYFIASHRRYMIHPCRTDAASEPRRRGLESIMSQVVSKALFESATCGRCGGSGNYSYNMMHGTRCYGCSGRGYVLTKRGRAAQNFLNDLRSKPVEDIKVGDLVYVDFFGGPRGFLKLESIRKDTLNLGQWMFEFPGRCSWGVHFGCGQTMRVGFSAEEKVAHIKLALEYQATLTKQACR